MGNSGKELIDFALGYTKRGWFVTPIEMARANDPGSGKRPILKGWTSHLLTENDVDQLFFENKDNVGILTGKPSKIVVLDFDSEAAFLRFKEQHPEALNTYTVSRDNAECWRLHLYYQFEGEAPKSAKGDGWDFQSTGRQVVAPPSRHYTGGIYCIVKDVPLLLWKSEYLQTQKQETLTVPLEIDSPMQGQKLDAYLQSALDQETEAVATTAQGNRNHRLNQAAFSLGQLVEAGLPEQQIINALLMAANQAGLSKSEALPTINSGLRSGKQTPRSIQENNIPIEIEIGRKSAENLLRQQEKEVVKEEASEIFSFVDASTYLDSSPPEPDPILENVFEKGDKVAVLGASKSRKTFFLLDLALHLAIGKDFLGLKVTDKIKVLYVNLEIKPNHFHRRVSMIARAMKITPLNLSGQLHIFNARGVGFDWNIILQFVLENCNEFDVVIFDPLYKLIDGDENSAKDMKPVLAAFDVMANKKNVAVIYSHHDAKGNPGDRNIRDRGAGSNILARDYDAGIVLTPHKADSNGLVLEFLCRNSISPHAKVVRFEGTFSIAEDLLPEVTTSKERYKQNKSGELLVQVNQAKEIAKQKVWKKSELKIEITTKVSGVTASRYDREILPVLKENASIYMDTAHLGKKPVHLIGPEALVLKEKQRLEKEYAESRQGKLDL